MAMNRVPFEEMPEDFQQKVKTLQEMGVDVRFLEMAANAPHMLDFYYGRFYKDVFFEGLVDIRTKELVRLHLANVHGCVLCKAGDTLSATTNGVSDTEIDALWDFEHGPFSDREKAALRVATGISMAQPEVKEIRQDIRQDLSNHFTDAQIVELIMVCGILTGIARMIFAYDLADRSDACPVIPPTA